MQLFVSACVHQIVAAFGVCMEMLHLGYLEIDKSHPLSSDGVTQYHSINVKLRADISAVTPKLCEDLISSIYYKLLVASFSFQVSKAGQTEEHHELFQSQKLLQPYLPTFSHESQTNIVNIADNHDIPLSSNRISIRLQFSQRRCRPLT